MNEVINEKVSVVTIYDREKRTAVPYKLKWHGRVYKITNIGYHHTAREGRTLNHIFSVTDGNLAFRLRLDTETLSWTLEQVSDGYPT